MLVIRVETRIIYSARVIPGVGLQRGATKKRGGRFGGRRNKLNCSACCICLKIAKVYNVCVKTDGARGNQPEGR